MAHERALDDWTSGMTGRENADRENGGAKRPLKEREEEYKTLFENLNVGVYRTTAGARGRYIKANAAFAAMFGYDSVEEVLEKSVSESYFNPGDRKSFMDEIVRTGCARRKELRLRKKDGSPFWGSATVTAKRDEDGNIQWLDGAIEDITERRESRERLEESHEILKSILSASPIGIGMIEHGRLRWINDEMARIFGFEDERDYAGKPLDILHPPGDAFEQNMRRIRAGFNTGEITQFDGAFARKNGETFGGHLKMSCPNSPNPSNRAIVTIYDLAWRKRADAARRQKEKLQTVLEITGAVCHELTQPTQAIMGYSDLLIMKMAKNDPLYEDLVNLRRQIDRIRNITDKLMSVTKYETKDYVSKKIIDIDKASKS
ncbi:MAG: PAS domain S-box protein [Desulfobacterales bacterium]|nr:PAS domain S-box protein [Desulfobacterales bacterium]